MDYRQIYEAKRTTAAKNIASNTFGAEAAPNDETKGLLTDIQRVPSASSDFGVNIPALIATLRNDAELTVVRLAALRTLRTTAFLGEKFAPFRADFLEALRHLTQPGIDPQLCKDALSFLAAEKDATAQDQLRRGLQEPSSALVSPATALQLLGFDDHANLAEIATQVFHKAADDLAAKEAALRLLATDAKSQDLFANLLQDKSQPRSLRALSATGLNFLNPQKFAELAENIVKDHSDFEDIRASALGALVNTPLHQVVRDNAGFLDEVKNLSAQTPFDNLRAAAGRFLAKQ
jgi:hypothetical protein